MKNLLRFSAFLLITASACAQDPAHATEFRKPTPGPGPDGKSQPTFLAHPSAPTTPKASPCSI